MTFRPITARTKLTFPCVVAYGSPARWIAWVAYTEDGVREFCTHWMPFQWPERKP
jgi:hypothetical protein